MATKIVTADEARKNLSDLLNIAGYANGRIEIQRRGKTAGFLIGPDDMRRLEALEDYIDNKEADEALAAIARGDDDLIPWEEAKIIIRGEVEGLEPKGTDS